mgnify:CR=1 FL=1
MDFLYIENLTKVFGLGTKNEVVAVKDLTLGVKKGEIVALLGPSGCGKTTTLRCIAGLETPTSGRIYIDGEDVTNQPPSRRDIGMVFQFAVVYDSVSVYENIALPLKAKKISETEIRRKVKEVAEFFGLSNYLDRKPAGLDIATRQRIALARALAKEPRILLLDEPLTPLDPLSRVKLRVDIKRLQKEKISTVIYVTHDQSEAMTLADRVAIMRDGKLIQCSTPENVYLTPADTFVARFIGEPGMNLIESKLIVHQGDAFINVGDQSFKLCSEADLKVKKVEDLILGIRPEHIDITDQPADLQGTVTFVEIHGNRSLVHININGNDVVVKHPTVFSGKINEKVWIRLQRDRIVLFDRETGRNLELKEASEHA